MTATEPTVATKVATQAEKFGQEAHLDSVQKASQSLLEDTDFQTAAAVPDSPLSREYTSNLTEQLVKQNLLPAVSLSYLGENFSKVDASNEAGKPANVTLAEVRKAQTDAVEGSVDAALYKAVGDMMESGQLPKEMTAEQIKEKLIEIDNSFQSQDRRNTTEVTNTLANKSLFNNIAQNDGQISKEDLDRFLAKPGSTDDDTLRQLAWLRDSWNDTDVRPLMETDENGNRFIREKIAPPQQRQGQPPAIDAVGDSPPASKQPAARAWGIDDRPPSADPNDKPHEWYVSDGNGNTIAVDYDADTGFPRYTVGTVDKDGSVHYTGWSYDKDSGKYLLLDGKQVLAEATAIDFSPIDRTLKPRGVLPRASQEEVHLQNGAI